MRDPIFSWRHLFAFVVTAAAGVLAWRLLQAAPPPLPPPPPRVMHIQLAPPPPPPAAQPPHPPEHVPPQPVPPRIASLPTAKDAKATMPAQATPSPQPVQAIAPPTPAPPAPPAPAPQVNTASLENAYAAKVNAAVEAQKHYPMSKDARLEQPRGAVVVWLLLSRAGAILDAGIDTSHGSILDRQALQSVRAATYPPFPADVFAGQEQHRFIVQLNFIPP